MPMADGGDDGGDAYDSDATIPYAEDDGADRHSSSSDSGDQAAAPAAALPEVVPPPPRPPVRLPVDPLAAIMDGTASAYDMWAARLAASAMVAPLVLMSVVSGWLVGSMAAATGGGEGGAPSCR